MMGAAFLLRLNDLAVPNNSSSSSNGPVRREADVPCSHGSWKSPDGWLVGEIDSSLSRCLMTISSPDIRPPRIFLLRVLGLSKLWGYPRCSPMADIDFVKAAFLPETRHMR